jgi:hypothetical protein
MRINKKNKIEKSKSELKCQCNKLTPYIYYVIGYLYALLWKLLKTHANSKHHFSKFTGLLAKNIIYILYMT